jgi:hypothetical protein
MNLLNQNSSKSKTCFKTLFTLLLLSAVSAFGQSNSALSSSKAAVMLSATLPAQLRLSLSTVNLDIPVTDPAQRSAIMTVPVTSSWVLDRASNNVELVGFFDSPETALVDEHGRAIPSDHVLGGIDQDNMAPFTESSRFGTANGSRTFYTQRISMENVSSTRTDTLNIQLNRIDDLNAPAGHYRGVLHLRLVSY